MDSKELRIGNYVYFKGVEVDVFSIEKNPIDWERVNGVRCEENYVSAIKPIPLTEEWLLKFGFDSNGWKGEFIKYAEGYIYLFGEESCIFAQAYKIEIKHVHQLQNLYFALTGEELTIKII